MSQVVINKIGKLNSQINYVKKTLPKKKKQSKRKII